MRIEIEFVMSLIPSDFTKDHSEYDNAINQLVETGRLEFSDFFPPEYEVNSPDKL